MTEEPKLGKVSVEAGEVTPEQMEELEAGEYFTIAQVAHRLRYTSAWINELVRQGRIHAIKPVGGRWRVPHSEFERLIKEGIPPMTREHPQPPVRGIEVDEETHKRLVRESEEKKERKPPGFSLDFFGIFPKDKE